MRALSGRVNASTKLAGIPVRATDMFASVAFGPALSSAAVPGVNIYTNISFHGSGFPLVGRKPV
jgi:hypothetical protein